LRLVEKKKVGNVLLGITRFTRVEPMLLWKPLLALRYLFYLITMIITVLIQFQIIPPELSIAFVVLQTFVCVSAVLPWNIEAMGIICKTFDFWYISIQEVFIGFIWCACCNWDLRGPAIFTLVEIALLTSLIDSAPKRVRLRNRGLLVFANVYLLLWTAFVYWDIFPNLSDGSLSIATSSFQYKQIFLSGMINLLFFSIRYNIMQFLRPGELLLVVAPVSHFTYR